MTAAALALAYQEGNTSNLTAAQISKARRYIRRAPVRQAWQAERDRLSQQRERNLQAMFSVFSAPRAS